MNPTRRTLLTAAAALAALGARIPAYAQAPIAGRNYAVLNPTLPVEARNKIEVLEFFWYGCIHCYRLEPTLEKWLKDLPADVEFRRVPAVFGDPRTQRDAAIYYTLDAMKLLDKLHGPLFDAIHRDRLRTDNNAALIQWLTKEGVDPKAFEDTLKSFGVQSKFRRAQQLTVAYRIDGTPQLAVHGTYTISADQGGTASGMFAVADYLVGIARTKK